MTPALLLAFSLAAPADAPATWTQWRGPTRNGFVAQGSAPWPKVLNNKALTKIWSADNLGPSYSGPIVSADKVFTTETVDKKEERVTAFDRVTGKMIWQVKWEGATTVPFFAAKNGSWIRATPAFDGERLYVAGIRDVLVCLNAADGKELWRFDCVKEFATAVPTFGTVCSPLVDDKSVYFQADGGVAKLEKATGKLIWQALKEPGGMMGGAFSSPVKATLSGQEHLVVQTRTALAGIDLESGKELWKRAIPAFRGMNILTPVTVGDTVFTSTYGGTTQGFTVASNGGGLRAVDGWSLKYEGHMCTPVVVDGHAYFLGKDRKMTCVEVSTGKQTWRSETGYSDYCSLVANGDRLLALDSKGKLILFKASPKEFEVVGEVEVGGGDAWAHLAVCGDEVFVRGLGGLTVYKWK
ncbi:MAG: PQQ-like beta-propeller repeat protein [Fimbriiglobus sp.]|jgi:outer membrane protein assembly factor BamB|nr:PQQ-like beta-propeller repeat protein [Fimbriiglobus sp.]